MILVLPRTLLPTAKQLECYIDLMYTPRDGESSLGPTIATLSLGAKATMYIRMKQKYYQGFSKSKKFIDDDPVLQGCEDEDRRRELKELLVTGRITRQAYEKQRGEIVPSGKRKCRDAAPAIKMELHHGDMIVMHGERLQKFYEVSVGFCSLTLFFRPSC